MQLSGHISSCKHICCLLVHLQQLKLLRLILNEAGAWWLMLTYRNATAGQRKRATWRKGVY